MSPIPKPAVTAELQKHAKYFEPAICRDIAHVIKTITANGELRDYDDEMANRLEDARALAEIAPSLFATITTLTAQLEKVRAEALEEAAKACEHFALGMMGKIVAEVTCHDCATRIRTLKEPKP